MIRLDAANTGGKVCGGVSRRDVLHAGALSLLGITLSDLFSAKLSGQVRGDAGVNCIMLNLVGAPGQHDTWDMKPDAPAEIRGPYKPIPTNVPGIQISEIRPTRRSRFAISYRQTTSARFARKGDARCARV